MIDTEPNIPDTGRYPIGKAAKILDIHRNTLRNHTVAGAIKCGIRKPTGRNFYTGAELKKFWKSQY